MSAIAIVPSGAEAAFLADLSVEDLPVSVEMRRRLRLLGLSRLGQLARLPQGAVAAQFGGEGARAWELAHGVDRSPVIPYRPPRVITERLAFPAPVETIDALLIATRTLLRRALDRPAARGRAARGIRLGVEMEDGRVWTRAATFREPVGSAERMLLALHNKIEAGSADGSAGVPAPFVEVELALLDLCGESALQGKLFSGELGHGIHTPPSGRLAEAARQLKVRYGRPVLGKVMEVEPWSRMPERRFALIDYDP
jgi:hypothetical protein